MPKVKQAFRFRISMQSSAGKHGTGQWPWIICKMPDNNRPQIVIESRNILLTVNVSINWGACPYSKVGNTGTTPTVRVEPFILFLHTYIFLSAPTSIFASALRMILAQSFSTNRFIFKLQNRSRLSRLNEPIVMFLDTCRGLEPESKRRRLIDLIE